MSATDYLKSLAAEITGVSIDKSRLAGEPGATREEIGYQQRSGARDIPPVTGYPARDDVDVTDPTAIAPARKTD